MIVTYITYNVAFFALLFVISHSFAFNGFFFLSFFLNVFSVCVNVWNVCKNWIAISERFFSRFFFFKSWLAYDKIRLMKQNYMNRACDIWHGNGINDFMIRSKDIWLYDSGGAGIIWKMNRSSFILKKKKKKDFC